MSKGLLFGLAVLFVLPAGLAFADGVSGDARLRWEYFSPDTALGTGDNFFGLRTRLNFDYAAGDGVSASASVQDSRLLGDGTGAAAMSVTQAYVSVDNLGSMPVGGFLDGWSMDVGRMHVPSVGGNRVINHDDWGNAGPASYDGFHLAGGFGEASVDWTWMTTRSPGGGSGTSQNTWGFGVDLPGMADMDASVYWWNADAAAGSGLDAASTFGFEVSNDSLVDNVSISFGYATQGGDAATNITRGGTLTSLGASYGMDGALTDVSVSWSAASGDDGATAGENEAWGEVAGGDAHGVHGISDLTADTDVEDLTISAGVNALEGIDLTVSFISLTAEQSGDDIGTELDVVASWQCGEAMDFSAGLYSYSDDTGTGTDETGMYIQMGVSFGG